ncbi:hypothetical protein [Streptomyces milbemycinicus]|uniref:hypothetical protein n=1 Tax=Streptomyces milbemycinicus TaxID=476552 RepID=UPI0029C9EB34|nr:hypothetical protein [Streptomyces milbemycinicus]
MVAVTRDVYTDDESGGDIVVHAPVIAFTTHEGAHVTALSGEGIPDPGRSLHRALTIHYAPTDPAVYTPDPAADRRSGAMNIAFVVALLLAGAGGSGRRGHVVTPRKATGRG